MIGVFSFIFDLLFLNIFNYTSRSTLIFPMFTITYIISFIYLRKNLLFLIIILLLYISLVGIIYYPFFFFILSYYYIKRDKIKHNILDYIFKISFLLIVFDSLLFLIIYCHIINSYSLSILFHKIFISVPINVLYSLILYYINYVLIGNKYKYIIL